VSSRRAVCGGVVFVVAVLVLLHVASCESDSDTFYGIDGVVRDKSTLVPIDSAEISVTSPAIGNSTKYTDMQGKFRFMTPETDDLRIVVSKQGYVAFDTTFLRIRANKENWTIGLERNTR
jgi:hypothetical protein